MLVYLIARIFRARYQGSDLGRDLTPTITAMQKRATVAEIGMAEGNIAEVYQ